jgi:DNA repair protein RecO
MTSFAHASYATELARELTVPGQPERDVFDLLIGFFRALKRGGGHVAMLRALELRLLDAVGLSPVFAHCVSCGADQHALLDRALFDVARGGVLCAGCGVNARQVGVRPLPPDVLAYLRAAGSADSFEDCRALTCPPDVSTAARAIMFAMLGHHIGKPLKSLDFAKKLRAAEHRGSAREGLSEPSE